MNTFATNALTTSLFEQAKSSKYNYEYSDEEKQHFLYLLEMKEKADKYDEMVKNVVSENTSNNDQELILKNIERYKNDIEYYRNSLREYEMEKNNNITFTKPIFNQKDYEEKTKSKILELEMAKERLERSVQHNTSSCIIC